jgi:AraC family transcriptional regulator, regulatory protein of adaptative response / DNA-3-methyladenine glycosylase II
MPDPAAQCLRPVAGSTARRRTVTPWTSTSENGESDQPDTAIFRTMRVTTPAAETATDSRYDALRARDRRFDGVFFVGVRSTGIYCRPICRARLPKATNCTFYDTAAAAELAGFRPCLQCRPERSPGTSRMDAANRIAAAAYARIAAGALNDRSVADLAADLCVGERQLRRAIQAEFGVTPIQLAQTQRLLLAKQLLMETDLPVAQVAYASGFRSLSRFNTLFLERYRLSPTRLRAQRGAGAYDGAVTLLLGYRPPFAWEHLHSFLAQRAMPGVERADATSYSRTMRIAGHVGWITVRHAAAQLAVAVQISESLLPVLMQVRSAVRTMFDLDAEPAAIMDHLARDPWLMRAAGQVPGLRLPGSVDPFEIAVRGVVGQQVSVAAATTIAARLAARYGAPVDGPDGLYRTSPLPEALAAAQPEDVAKLGMPLGRARTIVLLARAVVAGDVNLGHVHDVDGVKDALMRIPGIGPWTAEYIALRGLHWPDAFPATDLGVRRALARRTAPGDAELWRPWRGYAVIHLWESLRLGAA